MESYKQRPDFAEMQVRNLLKELNGKNHNNKVKAVKKFQDYVDEFLPEIYDDDVDMLFTGIDERDLEGLLFWGGVQSEHHKAALKRICPVVMSLIGHLVSLDYGDDSENIFFERYIRLPLDELIKLNFAAHMTEATKQSTDKGPLNNVCQLISLLLRDHCDVDTDQPDPLEIQSLLGDNGAITEHFMAWLQLTATTEIVSNISSERKKQVAIDRVRVVRPTTWAQVALKVVPVQPDEDGYGEKIDVDTDAHNRHVADPLGLVSTDLREIQTVHIGNSEKEQEENDDDMESRSRAQSRSRDPSTAPLIAAGAKRNSTMKGSDLFNLMRKISGAKDKVHSGGAGDTTTATTDSSITKSGKFSAVRSGDRGDVGVQVRAGAVSVLPIDRSFKPALFLALVHNKASMADLQTGLTNLQVLLDQQSNMRENLVRLHLGHFINCVDSIGWLKNYQFDNPTEMGYEESLGKRRKKAISGVATDVPEPGLAAAPIGRIDGEKMASQAVLKLEVAKKKALDTLAPILNSMKRSRQIKATDSILKRFASALDFPHLMQLALDKKDFEEVTRLNGRIKEMPNSVNLNIRNNIKSKANQILTQMRKILTNDALRQYPFSSLEEVLRLFKNLADIDSPSDYQIVLENCYERQHSLFLQRYAEITKSCDEDLKRASELDASHLLDVSHIPESISASSRPQLNNYKRSSRSTFGWDESRGEDQPAVGFGYIESDDEDSSADGDDSIIDEFWKTKDEAILFGSIRIKCLKKLEAEMRDSFPILQCMVTLLEASSVAGALPIESMLGSTSAVPTPDLAAGNYQSGILLAHSNSINLMSAPAALLKGMDVAYGRRHGGASKYANMLGTALHKYCLILKRLIEGFPDDVTSIAAAKEVSTASVHTAASAASPARRGLWSRIDDFEKVSTPAIEDIPLPPPPSATTTSMLFAQGSGDGFTAAAEKSILETQTNELLFHQNAINKCRELINEPFLSSSIRFLSDIVDNLELILAPTLSKIDDGTVGGGIWIRASSASAVGRASDSLRPVFFLPRSNPFFSSISSLHDVVHSGQEAIAAKALKVLEEAATRLMLSQEANAAIEMAQIEAGVESQKIRAGTDGNDAKESGKREGVISGETPIYDVNLLLYRACDNYKETYLGSRIRSAAASVIPLSLLNPELTSFNDNNSRTSANDDNEMNKYGVSLETKAYQLEYMIVHVLSSLHDSLRCPELVSNYVQSSIRVLFTQFLTDLSSAECPVLDAVGVVADDAANDQAGGLFGARRSAVSIDLEMIELDLKVDGGAGDKNVLIDGWYLDQIRACLAIRSLVVHRVYLMLSVLFPQSLDDGDEMSRALHATMQGSSSLKRSSLRKKGITSRLSMIGSAATNMLLGGNIASTTRKRTSSVNNTSGKGNRGYDNGTNLISPGLIDAAELDPTSILAYVKESVLHEPNETVASIVVEVCMVEDTIVQRYLEVQTLKLRTSIQASYSVVVKSELANKWGQSSRQSLINSLSQDSSFIGQQRVLPSSRVPSCLARVLFEMSLQRTELTKSLGWMTITEGLMTPAPSLEIAAALLAVHQKGNNSSQASLSGTNFKENGFDIQSKASAPESGWRSRVAKKLVSGSVSKQLVTDSNRSPISQRHRANSLLDDTDDDSVVATIVEHISHRYEEFLFCALCVSLLDVYTELIDELATNIFSVQATGKKVNVRRMSTIGPPPPSVTPKKRSDSTASEFLNRNDRILSKTPGGYGADSKHPKSLGRAAEEYVFLKTAIQPLLIMSAFESPVNVTIISEQQVGSQGSSIRDNDYFPSADELASATKIFIECFKKDRNLL